MCRSISISWISWYIIYIGRILYILAESFYVLCLLITLTCSPKAQLQRAQLNGIGRVHVRGASGCPKRSWMIPEHSSQARCFFFVDLGNGQSATPGTPCPTNTVWVFFNVPQLFATTKGFETGPPAYSSYPRRLESLTTYWCNYKGSTFYSVILRPWVLVRPESTHDLPHDIESCCLNQPITTLVSITIATVYKLLNLCTLCQFFNVKFPVVT